MSKEDPRPDECIGVPTEKPKLKELYKTVIDDCYLLLKEVLSETAFDSIKAQFGTKINDIENILFSLKFYISENLFNLKNKTYYDLISFSYLFINKIELFIVKEKTDTMIKNDDEFCLSYIAIVGFRCSFTINFQDEGLFLFQPERYDNFSRLLKKYGILKKIEKYYEENSIPIWKNTNSIINIYFDLILKFDTENRFVLVDVKEEENKITKTEKADRKKKDSFDSSKEKELNSTKDNSGKKENNHNKFDDNNEIKYENNTELNPKLNLENNNKVNNQLNLENNNKVNNQLNLENNNKVNNQLNLENNTEVNNQLNLDNNKEINNQLNLENNTEVNNQLNLENNTKVNNQLNLENNSEVNNQLNLDKNKEINTQLNFENNKVQEENLDKKCLKNENNDKIDESNLRKNKESESTQNDNINLIKKNNIDEKEQKVVKKDEISLSDIYEKVINMEIKIKENELKVDDNELNSQLKIELLNIDFRLELLEKDEKIISQSLLNSALLKIEKKKNEYLDKYIQSLKNIVINLSNPYNFNFWRKVVNIILKNIFIALKIKGFSLEQNLDQKIYNKLKFYQSKIDEEKREEYDKKCDKYKKKLNIIKSQSKTKNISPSADKERSYNLITISKNGKDDVKSSLSIDFLFYLKEKGNQFNHFDEIVLNFILFQELNIIDEENEIIIKEDQTKEKKVENENEIIKEEVKPVKDEK